MKTIIDDGKKCLLITEAELREMKRKNDIAKGDAWGEYLQGIGEAHIIDNLLSKLNNEDEVIR